MRQFFARLDGDEADMLDDLVARPERGQAFVLAHAPDVAATERVAAAVRPLRPEVLRTYDALTVTDLA